MKRERQLITHSPQNGRWGDCYRTCIAMVLGMNPRLVPHFCDGGDHTGSIESQEWLNQRGLSHVTIYYPPSYDIKEIMATLGHYSPDTPMILTGKSPRGTNHSVVALNGEIFCDPATGDDNQDALVGPALSGDGAFWWVEFISVLPKFWRMNFPGQSATDQEQSLIRDKALDDAAMKVAEICIGNVDEPAKSQDPLDVIEAIEQMKTKPNPKEVI